MAVPCSYYTILMHHKTQECIS